MHVCLFCDWHFCQATSRALSQTPKSSCAERQGWTTHSDGSRGRGCIVTVTGTKLLALRPDIIAVRETTSCSCSGTEQVRLFPICNTTAARSRLDNGWSDSREAAHRNTRVHFAKVRSLVRRSVAVALTESTGASDEGTCKMKRISHR